jgi:hypothetical protein
MKKDKTPEDLLEENLARCADSAAACLVNADAAIDIASPYTRSYEMDRAVALLHASARLADSLARLRGRTQTIRVEREGMAMPDGGSNGQHADG